MELRHLRYFVMVAEELHFGRAAARLFIAQPPLSQQIQQLERELGVALLARTSRRVSLTAAGEALLPRARSILDDVDEAGEVARRAGRGEEGWLGIGFASSATYDLLPEILRAFRESYPDVALTLREINAADQAAALGEGTIHVGFTRPPSEREGLVVTARLREPFVLAVPAGHPLAGRGAIALSETAGEDWIAFPERPAPSYGAVVRDVLSGAGVAPRVAQEALGIPTALTLVAAGVGVALLPSSVQSSPRRGVVYVPVREPAPRTELAVVSRQNDPSPTLANFLGIVQAHIAQREAA